jgi:uncharacterized protein YecT (DUF1311 family)
MAKPLALLGVWVASALALSACDRTKPAQARLPVATQAAAAPAAAATAPPAPVRTAAAAVTPMAAAHHHGRGGPRRPAGRTAAAHAARARGGAPSLQTAASGRASTVQAGAARWRDPGSSPAQGTHDDKFFACIAAADGFTAARANCYSAELARQGERLNRAYAAAMSSRSGEPQARLAEQQRAWTSLRDSRCRVQANRSDLLEEGSCRLEMTTRRAAELEQMAG